MSDTFNYAAGAVHHDHHRAITINGVSGRDLQDLLKAFLSDEAEEAAVVTADTAPAEVMTADAAPEVTAPKRRPAGRTSEPLFAEDEQEQAMAFAGFLREHRRLSTAVDTSRGNFVNRAFVAFYKHWRKAGLVPAQPNGNACYRFMRDECGLSMKSDMKTYGNFMRSYLLETDGEELGEVVFAVEQYLLGERMY
jgi:hypothetical protein